VKTAIKFVKKEIIIVDYIEHGTMMKQIDGIQGLELNVFYDEYFRYLEELVKKKGNAIVYKRILSLPISPERVVDNSLEAIEDVKRFIYDRTIAHIRRIKDLPNFELYIDCNSNRSFSSVFIDNAIWLRESDLWDTETRKARPDMLEINQDFDYSDCSNLIEHNVDIIKLTLGRLEKIKIDEFLKLFKEPEKSSTRLTV